MRTPFAIAVICFLFLNSFAQPGKKGGPGACIRPTVPPPDTTCFAGSGCRDALFNGDGYVISTVNPGHGTSIQSVLSQSDGKIVGLGQVHNEVTGSDFFAIRYNSDGSIDNTFGDPDPGNPGARRGYASIAISTGSDQANVAKLQPDGKIIAAGWSTNIGWVLIRLQSDGSLDPTFDSDGIAIPNQSGVVDGLALQSDGKIVVGGDSNFTVLRLNSNGSLDTSFGTGGRAIVNASTSRNGQSRIFSISLQRLVSAPSEERVVMGGWSTTSNGGATSFALMRLRSNGAIDTTFGTSGRVSTSFFGNGDQAREIAIDGSNRIVAGGMVRINDCSGTDFGVARYTENGQLDLSFGASGKASLDIYNGDNSPYGLTVQPDGKAIVGGNSVVTNSSGSRTYYFTLVRFDAAGNPDGAFGPGSAGPGVVTTRFDGTTMSSYLYSLGLQADGKILAAGVADISPVVVRYLQ